MEKKKDIHFSDVISTKMSCPDIAFETTFLNVLHEVDKIETEGDRLLLKDGKKTILIFQGK